MRTDHIINILWLKYLWVYFWYIIFIFCMLIWSFLKEREDKNNAKTCFQKSTFFVDFISCSLWYSFHKQIKIILIILFMVFYELLFVNWEILHCLILQLSKIYGPKVLITKNNTSYLQGSRTIPFLSLTHKIIKKSNCS